MFRSQVRRFVSSWPGLSSRGCESRRSVSLDRTPCSIVARWGQAGPVSASMWPWQPIQTPHADRTTTVRSMRTPGIARLGRFLEAGTPLEPSVQVIGQGARRCVAVGRTSGHRLGADPAELGGDRPIDRSRRVDPRGGRGARVRAPAAGSSIPSGPSAGVDPAQQFVEDDAEAVDVAPFVGLTAQARSPVPGSCRPASPPRPLRGSGPIPGRSAARGRSR